MADVAEPPQGATGRLRLSFDATAVPPRPVGAGRYTVDLARALGQLGDVETSIWCRKGDATRIGAATGGMSRTISAAPRPRAARLVWEQAVLPRLVAKLGADIHHAPHYTMPERCRIPVVVTIHDLTFLDHPEWHERSKVLLFRRAIRVAAKKAQVLICVSESTAQRLREHMKPHGSVVVVPHGVDRERFRPPEALEAEADEAVLRRAGVRRPYVLFVGTQEPRKAVPDLVGAFDRVATSHDDLSLVIAGGRGWGAAAVDAAVSAARHRERVLRTGYVDDETVAVLMRCARAVAYPALEEGFGLPALEALACGTPLVTTSGSAMSELAGGAALLVAPRDQSALAAAIDEAVRRGPEIESRISEGLVIAASHTWERSARGHLDAYRLAVQAGRTRP
ncbi:MAG: glycosyltransferase family 4 protein [Acidimicrobiales bacterium]